ncbi:MAG: lycopene cyclase domain-containing protein [Candidatus Nanopelagicales bacterium]|nr:lycopene cyclase domain-containing protein [Candidatus Nanopelagicales bacterium]
MAHLAYLSVLAGCLVGTAWLEIALRTRVYRRWLRLLLTVLPVVVIFSAWDLYAIASDHWDFDPRLTTTVLLPGGLPLDEVLFFVVIPICAVLTLEAVRSVKGWELGDESPLAKEHQQDDPRRSQS